MCCAGPTHPKTLQGNRESRQVPRLFCLPFAVVSHLRSLCKNNSLLQSAKEMAQCTRINAVAGAFLISTVFNKHGRRMRRCDIPLGLLGDRHAESLGIRTASGRVSKVSGSNENTRTKKAPGGHCRRVGQARA